MKNGSMNYMQRGGNECWGRKPLESDAQVAVATTAYEGGAVRETRQREHPVIAPKPLPGPGNEWTHPQGGWSERKNCGHQEAWCWKGLGQTYFFQSPTCLTTSQKSLWSGGMVVRQAKKAVKPIYHWWNTISQMGLKTISGCLWGKMLSRNNGADMMGKIEKVSPAAKINFWLTWRSIPNDRRAWLLNYDGGMMTNFQKKMEYYKMGCWSCQYQSNEYCEKYS